ncbi:MAG: hypothetical protein RLZZ527_512 [Actinomycetota bacterium]
MTNDLRWIQARVAVIEDFGISSTSRAGLNSNENLIAIWCRAIDFDYLEVARTGEERCLQLSLLEGFTGQ